MNYELYFNWMILFFMFIFGYVLGAYMQLIYMMKKEVGRR